MGDDLKDTIKQSAEGPASADADGLRMKQHGLRDQIEADKCVAGRDAELLDILLLSKLLSLPVAAG